MVVELQSLRLFNVTCVALPARILHLGGRGFSDIINYVPYDDSSAFCFFSIQNQFFGQLQEITLGT